MCTHFRTCECAHIFELVNMHIFSNLWMCTHFEFVNVHTFSDDDGGIIPTNCHHCESTGGENLWKIQDSQYQGSGRAFRFYYSIPDNYYAKAAIKEFDSPEERKAIEQVNKEFKQHPNLLSPNLVSLIEHCLRHSAGSSVDDHIYDSSGQKFPEKTLVSLRKQLRDFHDGSGTCESACPSVLVNLHTF